MSDTSEEDASERKMNHGLGAVDPFLRAQPSLESQRAADEDPDLPGTSWRLLPNTEVKRGSDAGPSAPRGAGPASEERAIDAGP